VLTIHAGANLEPLIIVGVVVSYIVTLVLAPSPAHTAAPEPAGAGTATAASAP